MRRVTLLRAGAALLVQSCAPAGPAPSATSAATPAAAPSPATVPSLRLAILADEGTLQPYTYKTGYPGWNMLMLVYDSVMQLDADNVPRPLLAREVKAAGDGATYDIALRSGITWHDGQPLTADDVKFSYEYFLQNVYPRFTSPLRAIDSIATKGASDLTIALKAPNPSFPIRALADVPILPRHLWSTVEGTKVREFPATVGSGPYRLVEVAPDRVYRLQANRAYFLGAPPVDELIFPVIADLNTTLQALRAGEVHGLTRALPPEQVMPFSQPPFKVARGASFLSTLLQINDERPPFDRKEIRQAVDLAV